MRNILILLLLPLMAACSGPATTASGEKVFFDVSLATSEVSKTTYNAIAYRKSFRNSPEKWSTQFDPNFQFEVSRLGKNLALFMNSKFNLVEISEIGYRSYQDDILADTAVARELFQTSNPTKQFRVFVSREWVQTTRNCYKKMRDIEKMSEAGSVSFNINSSGVSIRLSDKSYPIRWSALNGDHHQVKRGLNLKDANGAGLFYIGRHLRLERYLKVGDEGVCEAFVPKILAVLDFENANLEVLFIDSEMGYRNYTAIPSNKLICADLTKNYWHVRKKQGQAFMANLLLAAIQSYTATSSTTYSGTARTSYNGHYANRNFSAYGTSNFSAYSRTYDYSYIGDRAATALTIALAGSASIDQIKSGMSDHNCIIP